jgi:uncharacterized cupin superfamily protein
MEPFMVTLESGGSSGPYGMIHTGHEFVFCLRGTLEYEIDDQHFVLQSGDSLLFAAQQLHRWRNPGKTVTNAIIVLSGFEESERPSEFHFAPLSTGEKAGDDSQPGKGDDLPKITGAPAD